MSIKRSRSRDKLRRCAGSCSIGRGRPYQLEGVVRGRIKNSGWQDQVEGQGLDRCLESSRGRRWNRGHVDVAHPVGNHAFPVERRRRFKRRYKR
jgi:hypothetical protein